MNMRHFTRTNHLLCPARIQLGKICGNYRLHIVTHTDAAAAAAGGDESYIIGSSCRPSPSIPPLPSSKAAMDVKNPLVSVKWTYEPLGARGAYRNKVTIDELFPPGPAGLDDFEEKVQSFAFADLTHLLTHQDFHKALERLA